VVERRRILSPLYAIHSEKRCVVELVTSIDDAVNVTCERLILNSLSASHLLLNHQSSSIIFLISALNLLILLTAKSKEDLFHLCSSDLDNTSAAIDGRDETSSPGRSLGRWTSSSNIHRPTCRWNEETKEQAKYPIAFVEAKSGEKTDVIDPKLRDERGDDTVVKLTPKGNMNRMMISCTRIDSRSRRDKESKYCQYSNAHHSEHNQGAIGEEEGYIFNGFQSSLSHSERDDTLWSSYLAYEQCTLLWSLR
jgi:hypothetical protein